MALAKNSSKICASCLLNLVKEGKKCGFLLRPKKPSTRDQKQTKEIFGILKFSLQAFPVVFSGGPLDSISFREFSSAASFEPGSSHETRFRLFWPRVFLGWQIAKPTKKKNEFKGAKLDFSGGSKILPDSFSTLEKGLQDLKLLLRETENDSEI